MSKVIPIMDTEPDFSLKARAVALTHYSEDIIGDEIISLINSHHLLIKFKRIIPYLDHLSQEFFSKVTEGKINQASGRYFDNMFSDDEPFFEPKCLSYTRRGRI